MEFLEENQIKEKIKFSRRPYTIKKAILHQNRIKFHVENVISADISRPSTDFLNFVSNLIPADKFKIFKTLFRYPLKTNEITGICFDKLSRIFEGRNPVFNYEFSSSEMRQDWENYRTTRLKEPEIWSTKGWDYFKTEINSVLIIDLPRQANFYTTYSEPYFYWLPISNVINFSADRITGEMNYIIFEQDEQIVVIDGVSYKIYEQKDGNIGAKIVDNPHYLGYCPARFFWDEPLNLEDPDVKISPITKELEALDWYLFYHLSKRHLDLYGSYPIYSGYEQSCDFSNKENGDYCDGGFLKDKDGYYKYDASGVLALCPKCGEKRIAGVGSFISIPIPSKDQPDLRNPIQMLTVDRNSLDYNVNEEMRLRNDIITSIIGTNEDITTKDAINEKQIKANFESQSTILNKIKKGFESAMSFVDNTICRLRYGKEFLYLKINLGTEFFIYDPIDLRKQYQIAKESGASASELDALQTQIIETEYRNDALMRQRLLLLSDLEPYKFLTTNEVITLYEKNIISNEELLIKLNFNSLVKKFERENMNILEFAKDIPYDKKINLINENFKRYVSKR